MFFPDGERSCLIPGEAALRDFCEGQLRGRNPFDVMGGGQRVEGQPIPAALWRYRA